MKPIIVSTAEDNTPPLNKVLDEYYNASIKAYEDWTVLGVGVSANGNRAIVINGTYYLQLTAEEALNLATQLIKAAQDSMKIDRQYNEDMIKELKENNADSNSHSYEF